MTPMYGGSLSFNYHTSFNQLNYLCREQNIALGWSNVWNESLISRARNRLVDNYLKENNHTHGVFIDADIGFEPNDVLAMLETDLDIAAAPCSKKSLNWPRIQTAVIRRFLQWMQNNPAARNGHNAEELIAAYQQSGAAIPPQEFPQAAGDFVFNFAPFEGEKIIDMGKPEEMLHMGTGLMMVKRKVFEAFKKAYPNRWYESAPGDTSSNPGPIHDFFKVGVNPESRQYLSEDYWFCRDAAALGFKVWMLPWIKTTHVGSYSFVGDMPAALAMSGGQLY